MKINIEPNWASLQKYHRARLDEIHVSWDALDEISAWLGSIDSNDALAEMREYFLGRQKRCAEAAAAREDAETAKGAA